MSKALHNTMKKYIIAIFLVSFAEACYSNEWIPVGEQPELKNTNELEANLWSFLHSKTKLKFQVKESYRFQYKYINESIVLVNAICLGSPDANSELGAFPGPTSEELKKGMYEVFDGGSCFFNLKYNIKSGAFTSLYVNGEA
jgi:hypothetical protein